MKTVKEIRDEFLSAKDAKIHLLIEKYGNDTRSGVRSVVKKYRRQEEELEKEKLRTEEMKAYEYEYGEYEYICGIDEAGRGPLAGPVVAGAVILPKSCDILYINDSKKLSEKKREELYEIIIEKAVSVGVGIVGPEKIDEINILQATYEAMRKAVKNLAVKPDLLLIDAVRIPELDIRQIPIIKGDAKSISIAAGSIIAKVTRDRMMREYDLLYPEYGFAGHKGYGCASHIEKIKKIGPSPIHRKTFIKNFVSEDERRRGKEKTKDEQKKSRELL
jgi:ribonuclease HII